jgi:hypothetical protein
MSKPKTKTYQRPGKLRNIGVSKEDNAIFQNLLLDLKDMNVNKCPDQLADEIFKAGLYLKNRELQNSKS